MAERANTCLIGGTGFVGGNLARAKRFDLLVSSKDIATIRGARFDLVVCAAPHAKKWWANLHPDDDARLVEGLMRELDTVAAERFVLVSTIDVFPRIRGIDERFDCHGEPNHAYGRNRLALEDFVARQFRAAHVVRLPGLFGPGLKKNAIYDLVHENELEKIDPRSEYQWYDVERLWVDIQIVMERNLPLVMLATEPVRTEDLRSAFFPHRKLGAPKEQPVRYDVRTIHDREFGGSAGYVMRRDEIMCRLGRYLRS
jgi:nucleoside-diphosphate-sugar epimerase